MHMLTAALVRRVGLVAGVMGLLFLLRLFMQQRQSYNMIAVTL
jgi:hypothetical protein